MQQTMQIPDYQVLDINRQVLGLRPIEKPNIQYLLSIS